MNGRILVLNCHEPWIHQLRLLDRSLDIVVGLPGRHTRDWDHGTRPVPPKARLISLQQAFAERAPYDCIIAHNLSDLLDTRTLPGPRMLIIHLTLEGMILEQNAQTSVVEYRNAVAEYTERVGAHVVAVSSLKGKSWGFTEHIVPLTANPAEYLPWTGELACGLRVSNFVLRRARTRQICRRSLDVRARGADGHERELARGQECDHRQRRETDAAQEALRREQQR